MFFGATPFCDRRLILGLGTNDVLPVHRASSQPGYRADRDLGLDWPAGIRANQTALECADRQPLCR